MATTEPLKPCPLGCTDSCKAKEHGCASECPSPNGVGRPAASHAPTLGVDHESLYHHLLDLLGAVDHEAAAIEIGKLHGLALASHAPMEGGGWRAECEIIPAYMPPFPRRDTRPIVAVRFRKIFLRYSKGPEQGFFWDIYGEDFQTEALARTAIAAAPCPPGIAASSSTGAQAEAGEATIDCRWTPSQKEPASPETHPCLWCRKMEGEHFGVGQYCRPEPASPVPARPEVEGNRTSNLAAEIAASLSNPITRDEMVDAYDKMVGHAFRIEHLLAAALRSPSAGEWEPMETAPRDGTRVAVWYDFEPEDDDESRFDIARFQRGMWLTDGGVCYPDRWSRLPKTPTSSTTETNDEH